MRHENKPKKLFCAEIFGKIGFYAFLVRFKELVVQMYQKAPNESKLLKVYINFSRETKTNQKTDFFQTFAVVYLLSYLIFQSILFKLSKS
jgi:hypothetical protein